MRDSSHPLTDVSLVGPCEGNRNDPQPGKGPSSATADYLAGRIEEPIWRARIEARRPYELWVKDRTTNRMVCPVLARVPSVKCVRHDETLRVVDSRPKVVPGPDVEDGRICHTSQGIRIPIEAGAKLTQEFPHATEEWRTVYNALRNAIEGLNGYAKDEAAEALAVPGRRRLRGLAKTSMAVAFLLFAANVRAIRSLLTSDEIPGRPPRKRKRRRYQDYLPRRVTAPPASPAA